VSGGASGVAPAAGHPDGSGPDEVDASADGAAQAAVAAFARAVRLSCLAARRAAPADLANRAVAAHVAARDWAEEAVRRAAGGRG
jgi:hypothetical protein